MSEYGVICRIGHSGQPFFVLLEDGKTSQSFSAEEFADFAEKLFNKFEEDLCNIENNHSNEIASLQDAAAEKDAIIEAQSEKLGEARQLKLKYGTALEDIHLVISKAPLASLNKLVGEIDGIVAQALTAQWEAESESEAVE